MLALNEGAPAHRGDLGADEPRHQFAHGARVGDHVRVHRDDDLRAGREDRPVYGLALAQVLGVAHHRDAPVDLRRPQCPDVAVVGGTVVHHHHLELFPGIILLRQAEDGAVDALALVVDGHDDGDRRFERRILPVDGLSAHAAQEWSEDVTIHQDEQAQQLNRQKVHRHFRLAPLPTRSLVGFRTTPPPLPERGWNVRRARTKGKGLPALVAPGAVPESVRPERRGAADQGAGWISRTLSQRKSTSSALSHRKVAIGPPQAMGIPGALAPQALPSPPKVPSSVMSYTFD